MSAPQRRNLRADVEYVLAVAERIQGRLEITQAEGSVKAMLMHDHPGAPALVGAGKNATEAVADLRAEIVRMVEAMR